MDPYNSTSYHDKLNQDLTISILAFTVAGFCLSAYVTGKVLWKSVTNVSPRTISNEEAGLIAGKIINDMPDVFIKNAEFMTKLVGALHAHDHQN
jgi:hypothetical protein